MLKDGNRRKLDLFKNKKMTEGHGPFGYVKSNVRTRMIDPQIMIMFFTFNTRKCDFGDYIELLDNAKIKIG